MTQNFIERGIRYSTQAETLLPAGAKRGTYEHSTAADSRSASGSAGYYKRIRALLQSVAQAVLPGTITFAALSYLHFFDKNIVHTLTM